MSEFVPGPISRVIPGEEGAFSHHFGGPAYHTGSTPQGAVRPIHLLYVLDCSDPLVPISIPGIRQLPLYYAFQFDASALGYRVISDDEIEILYIERPDSYDPNFPYDNYPREFARVPVRLEEIEPSDYVILQHHVLESDSECGTVEPLSAEEENRLAELGHPFTQLGGEHAMCQGIPEEKCPNPKCENHEDMHSLDVFAVVWDQPTPGAYLWDDETENRWDEDVETIFMICPLCKSILSCNRCT